MIEMQTPETPVTPTVTPAAEPSTPEPAPLSVTEHARLHGERKDAIPAEEKTALEAREAHHSETQRRDPDGTFGKGRHRAQSQQARAEDVPRIRELSGKNRELASQLEAAQAELARLKAQHAPQAQVAAAERTVERVEARTEATEPAAAQKNDPEPKETDAKYQGDYALYLEERADWRARKAAREEWAAIKQADADAAERQRTETAKMERLRTFGQRIDEAKKVYPDYEETLRWDVPWLQPNGTPHRGYEAIDAFIQEDETGAHVLQYLRTHPDEVDALLQAPPLKQVGRLTLLAQRFASSPSGAADSTGAAPRPTVVQLPPKPPTPVRTGAQKVVGTTPTDGSLSVLGHAKAFKYSR